MQEPTTTRRTVAQGAAWAVPVIAIGAATPAMAASPLDCVPNFTIIPGDSFKCCDGGPDKNMKVAFQITDVNGCIASGGGALLVSRLALGNGQAFVDLNVTVEDGGVVIGFLREIQSCTDKIKVTFQIGTRDPQTVTLSSDNIPSGNDTGDCVAA